MAFEIWVEWKQHKRDRRLKMQQAYEMHALSLTRKASNGWFLHTVRKKRALCFWINCQVSKVGCTCALFVTDKMTSFSGAYSLEDVQCLYPGQERYHACDLHEVEAENDALGFSVLERSHPVEAHLQTGPSSQSSNHSDLNDGLYVFIRCFSASAIKPCI